MEHFNFRCDCARCAFFHAHRALAEHEELLRRRFDALKLDATTPTDVAAVAIANIIEQAEETLSVDAVLLANANDDATRRADSSTLNKNDDHSVAAEHDVAQWSDDDDNNNNNDDDDKKSSDARRASVANLRALNAIDRAAVSENEKKKKNYT